MTRKEIEKFYTGRKWRKVRAKVLRDQHFECQRCLKERHKVVRATTVHHELPLKDYPQYGLQMYTPDGQRNLIALCFDCHEEIEKERGNRPGSGTVTQERWD
jgi:5-methylcytosine-specific restriction endonuclease McrA